MFYFLETLATLQNKLRVSLLCRYNHKNSLSEFFFFYVKFDQHAKIFYDFNVNYF